MTQDQKVILYSINNDKYRAGRLDRRAPDEYPVCTQEHFVDTIMKCAEEVFPRMGSNPFWQDRDWDGIEKIETKMSGGTHQYASNKN